MKHLLLALAIILASTINGQTERLNNKGKLFVGAELGGNVVHKSNDNVIHSQIGVSGEYYFARRWSISTKIKFHKAYLYYYVPKPKPYPCKIGGLSCGDREEKIANFESYNILIPINLKWDYKITKNFYGYINGGFFLNLETKSYRNVTDNVKLNHNPIYASINIGTGLGYQLKNNDVIYVDYNFYRGGDMIKESFLFGDSYYPINSHISIGYHINLNR